ncbi:hypothetical protein BKH46_01090 [Helicobacter sp. 12S02634-8]|uniref:radical SAM protein n=1 Tax=Helicobacter sp. 12S02634-8 TaxID=1476199 RepID=UPI000BA4F905|nr:radical SAM protein [Helicobacter sp. 12S02634-8]PAF48529.1 hypothetical protein BKH46_01090 [Helicobacter sp. 12S02634-8]
MENIVFGPVISRRFGLSLGVDLSPSAKQCNFDCLYCELEGKRAMAKMEEVLELEVLVQSVLKALRQNPKIDVLTITANGEPTLYPYLFEFMEAIKPYVPSNVATLILSNGSRFGHKEVQRALCLFDIVKFSLDGADTESFLRVDRPHRDISLGGILEGIRDFAKIYHGELVAEVLLVEGVNDTASNIQSIVKFLQQISVSRIDLGTIDRPPAHKANALSYEQLSMIAREFEGMYVSLPLRKQDMDFMGLAYSKEALIEFIARRPVSVSEALILFEKATLERLEILLHEGKISRKKVANLEFYTLKREK